MSLIAAIPVEKLVAASASFQGPDLFFEYGDRWVGVPPVDVPRLLAQRHGPPAVEVVIAERDAVDHRHLSGASPVNPALARPDGQRARSVSVPSLLQIGHGRSPLRIGRQGRPRPTRDHASARRDPIIIKPAYTTNDTPNPTNHA